LDIPIPTLPFAGKILVCAKDTFPVLSTINKAIIFFILIGLLILNNIVYGLFFSCYIACEAENNEVCCKIKKATELAKCLILILKKSTAILFIILYEWCFFYI